MHKCTFILAILCTCCWSFNGLAQDVNKLLNDAHQLEAKFQQTEALQKYLEVLRYQGNNLEALCKTSELYNVLGKRQQGKDKQKDFYRTAKAYAQKALQVNPNSSEANFVMAIAMGRMALISPGQEKINAVKGVRSYAEKCIQLDPNNYKGYHVLGKWHYEVSDLSGMEKWLVKMSYGSLPPASLDDAIRNYEKSRQINPRFILNYIELAKAYHRKDNDTKAIELINTMLKMPDTSADDPHIKEEGRKLLKEWD